MNRAKETWISDTSLVDRIRSSVEVMLRAKGNYNSRMKHIMQNLRVLREADFPSEFQHHWQLVLSVDGIALVKFPGGTSVLSYGRVPAKFRDIWSKSLLKIYDGVVYEKGRIDASSR